MIYNSELIKERHRHRYEVNNKYAREFEQKGVIFSGYSPDGLLPEIVELKDPPLVYRCPISSRVKVKTI